MITNPSYHCLHNFLSGSALGSVLEPGQAVASHLRQNLVVERNYLVVEGVVGESGPVLCSYRPGPGSQLISSCCLSVVGVWRDNSSLCVLWLSRCYCSLDIMSPPATIFLVCRSTCLHIFFSALVTLVTQVNLVTLVTPITLVPLVILLNQVTLVTLHPDLLSPKLKVFFCDAGFLDLGGTHLILAQPTPEV